MSATATVHRTTTRPGWVDTDCVVCTRPGLWDWQYGVVRHGPRRRDMCVLPQPAPKRETV